MSDIGYIREEISSFDTPEYKGERYEALVPDTLDIAERSRLAINGLTGPTDPDADHEIYWWVDFFQHPTVMQHDHNDHVQVKFWEALPLLRSVTGSEQNEDVDEVWREVILRGIGPDGLFYFPRAGREWTDEAVARWFQTVWRSDGSTTDITDESVEHWTDTLVLGRTLSAVTVFFQEDGEEIWRKTGEGLVDGLTDLAVDEGEYAYFLPGCYEPNAEFPEDADTPVGHVSQEVSGRVVEGLAHFYAATEYEPARNLAEKLATYQLEQAEYFDDEGRFLVDRERAEQMRESDDFNFVGDTSQILEDDPQVDAAHFHSHTIALLSVLEYALTVGDEERIDFVKRSFEWAKTKESECSTLVGFFPEFIIPDYPSSETCEVADMISLAVKLSEAGVGDYWDDVSRWVRNQFAENQLTECDWVDRVPARSGLPMDSGAPTDHQSVDDVAERNLGAFAGWPSGNDWAIRYGIMHCCTGNATRTLYYVWDRILRSDDNALQVDLLLNRASPEADVHSYLPYTGRVDVELKETRDRVSVRMPDWVESGSEDVKCTVDDDREITWEGQYVVTGPVESDEVISFTFPLEKRVRKEVIGGESYVLDVHGHTIVDISPSGEFGPLYQRNHYKSDDPSWRTVERFVPSDTVPH